MEPEMDNIFIYNEEEEDLVQNPLQEFVEDQLNEHEEQEEKEKRGQDKKQWSANGMPFAELSKPNDFQHQCETLKEMLLSSKGLSFSKLLQEEKEEVEQENRPIGTQRRQKLIRATFKGTVGNRTRRDCSEPVLNGASIVPREACKVQFVKSKSALKVGNLRQFLFSQSTPEYEISLQIQRKHTGMFGLGVQYHFRVQDNGYFLFVAEKQGISSSYIFSTSATRISENCETYLAKLQGKWLSNQFEFFDDGFDCERTKILENSKRQLAFIEYTKAATGPRKMNVHISTNNNENTDFTVLDNKASNVIRDKWENMDRGQIGHFYSKKAVYDPFERVYKLDMEGMGAAPSMKNFILENGQYPNALMMCRKSDDVYACRVKAPFSVIQAGGLCLSSIHCSL